MQRISYDTHKGPPIEILAIVFTCLYIGGLSFVISFSPESTHFPAPGDSSEIITAYFSNYPSAILMCAFLQFGAAIPLGLYVVTTVSRLHFLGIRAAGSYIALFGGILAALNIILSSLFLWVMAYPEVAKDAAIIRVLYYVVYAVGGVGYSVPLGLFFAGVSVTSYFAELLPKWITWFGLLLAVFGELSWLSLIFPNLLFFIPLTRFLGFIWLIAIGFKLPKTTQRQTK